MKDRGRFSLLLVVFVMMTARCSTGGPASVDATSNTDSSSISDIVNANNASKSETPPQLLTVEQLPRATSPVIVDVNSPNMGYASSLGASSGSVLQQMNASSFDTNSSLAMCETAVYLRESLEDAARADSILCYLQATLQQKNNKTMLKKAGIDLYDGKEHIIDISFQGAKSYGALFPKSLRIKMKTHRNEKGYIDDFKLWSCQDGQFDSYISETLSGNSFSMLAKQQYQAPLNNMSQTTVTGIVNQKGQFLYKAINTTDNHINNNGTFGYGQTKVMHGPYNAAISSWHRGTQATRDQHGKDDRLTYVSQFFALSELIYGDRLSVTALGDGAAIGQQWGTYSSGIGYTNNFQEGWDGDTKTMSQEVDELAYLSQRNDLIPATDTEPKIAFKDEERYNCSGEKSISITVPAAHLLNSCSHLKAGGEWINCHALINSQPTKTFAGWPTH